MTQTQSKTTRHSLLSVRDAAVEGTLVIGRTRSGKAICYAEKVTTEVLRDMYAEAAALGLAKPLVVLGETCEQSETKSFKFTQVVR